MLKHQKSEQQEGFELAKAYIRRQFWRLKWLTLGVAGILAWYTISTGDTLVPLSGVSWTLTVALAFFYQIRMNKLFQFQVSLSRRGKEIPSDITKSIMLYAWGIWGLFTITVYWLFIMLYPIFFGAGS